MSIKDNIENESGIYKLGFNIWSFLGVSFPLIFTIVVGGALAFFLTR